MKQLAGILLIFGILSCQKSKSRTEYSDTKNLTSGQVDSILTEFKFQYENPIVLDSSNQVLIPISTELLERRTKLSKDGYYSDDFPRYWNILFYNRETGENRLLTENKLRISYIHAKRKNLDEDEKIMSKKILYEIGDIDFNNDKTLDDKDPEYLFSSEINGLNFKRISPINEHLQYFEVIPKSEQLLIRTLRDTNQDSIFNTKDELIWYNAKLENQEWTLTEIIDSIGRKRIEKLYFEQWLKKN
ncbi:MAG: hypothetical protein KA536_11680 [Saprospiraceae bacterium]|nr:hypothetical protein [Saprospiraceae bacterium]